MGPPRRSDVFTSLKGRQISEAEYSKFYRMILSYRERFIMYNTLASTKVKVDFLLHFTTPILDDLMPYSGSFGGIRLGPDHIAFRSKGAFDIPEGTEESYWQVAVSEGRARFVTLPQLEVFVHALAAAVNIDYGDPIVNTELPEFDTNEAALIFLENFNPGV